MSKFEELKEKQIKSRAEINEYHLDCKKFAKKVINGLVDYLEVPKENFQFLPLDKDKEINENHNYPMEIELKEDTYFHVRFRIYWQKLTAMSFIFWLFRLKSLLVEKCGHTCPF